MILSRIVHSGFNFMSTSIFILNNLQPKKQIILNRSTHKIQIIFCLTRINGYHYREISLCRLYQSGGKSECTCTKQAVALRTQELESNWIRDC